MEFPDGYSIAMTLEEIKEKWPKLIENINFQFTSLKTWDYNCVAHVLGIDNDWIDFYYTDEGDINSDLTINRYVELFEEHGFSKCEDSSIEKGFEKIAIYEDSRKWFSHVALQFENGDWTSKMGDYEDIKHVNIDSVSTGLYGQAVLFMKRPRNSQLK